jgi:hypothetical protein
MPLGASLIKGSSPFFYSFTFFLKSLPLREKVVAAYLFSDEVKELALFPGTPR